MKNRLLANSFPKGGSTLLAETIELLSYKNHIPTAGMPKAFNYKEARDALHNIRYTENIKEKIAISPFAPWYAEYENFRHWLNDVSPDYYIFGHLPWVPVLDSLIEELNFRHLVIIRDPRSILASLIFEEGITPRFLTADLDPMSLSERLAFMTSGGYALKADATVQSFTDSYRSMLAWRNDKNCLVVRFEELVGEWGENTQREAAKKIASYLNVQFGENILEILNRPDAPWGKRFRTDQLKKWKDLMREDDIDYILNRCEVVSQDAGYDQVRL
ncbi:MAG: hypothetical protein D3903_18825 [Candidatus Electrothrix sp. GM3_4]|nr:hypothetical protein [Candidatus Electrothrix sp. GM3_4]